MVAVAARVGKSHKFASGSSIRLTRKGAHLAGAAVALMLFGSSGALAQNCNIGGLPAPFTNIGIGLGAVLSAVAGSTSSVVSSLSNESTAFFTQQTSAFVAGARADRPDQDSGGIWARQVGGVVDIKSETKISASLPALGLATSATCNSRVHQTYVGTQVGADVARLNMNGWNVTVGLTAGYLETAGQDVAPTAIRSDFQVPFIGGYGVATNGGFFTDLMIRREFYNGTVNQPALNLNSQEAGARAWSISVGAGYNFGLADGYFIEPSIGMIYSRTSVDPASGAGPVILPIGGTAAVTDIESNIFRATLRAGRNFTVGDMSWQPFGSASLFYEGAPKVVSNFVSCVGCAFVGPLPVTALATAETSRVGAFGQLSVGLAAQALGTGWVGFVRGDYRYGINIEGWSGNAGLRYNFSPEKAVATKMVTKSPVLAAAPYNWTGFYLGGHLGAAQGRGHVDFVGTGVSVNPYVAGYLAGGQFGYNAQYGSYVVGFEVDASKTNLNGTAACGTSTGRDPATGLPFVGPAGFSPFYLSCKDSLDWIATAALRLGVLSYWSDRTLLFVKAGGALTRETVAVGCIIGVNNIAGFVPSCQNPAGALTSGFSGSTTRAGALVGLGSEFGLTREWSAKAELNYIWFGNRDVTTQDGTRLSIGTGVAEAKIGLNYRFGQSYPLVMKY